MKKLVVAGAGVLALTLAAFAQVTRFDWVNWDDPVHVLDNPFCVPGSEVGLARAWTGGYRGLYIPVSYSLFAAEAALTLRNGLVGPLGHPAAWPFHAVSLLLHCGCVFLAWRLVRRLVADDASAAVGAALFAVHPLQVEAVAWVSEQRGLLAALLGMAALKSLPRLGGRFGVARTAAATAAFVAALLAKPSAMVVPPLAFALAAWHGRSHAFRLLPLVGAWSCLALACGILTAHLQPVQDGVAPAVWLRPAVAGDTILFYLRKLVAPSDLCVDYGRTPAVALADPWCSVRAAAAWGLVVVACLMPPRPVRVAAALWLIPLLPVLGFVPFVFQGISTVADRYCYLAMLGPAVAVAVAWRACPRPVLRIAVVGVLLACTALSATQGQVWRDSLTLNRQALRINGGTRDTCNNLGLALLEAGATARAIECLRMAVARDPHFPSTRFNLGLALHRLGRNAEAEAQYRAAVQLRPGYAKAHNNLGILLAESGRHIEAEAEFRATLNCSPGDPDATQNLRRLEAEAQPD